MAVIYLLCRLRVLSNVLRGTMAAQLLSLRCRGIRSTTSFVEYSATRKLPETYDEWLKRANLLKRIAEGGFGVARIWIRLFPCGWCKERNVSPDQRARLIFANEARDLPARQ